MEAIEARNWPMVLALINHHRAQYVSPRMGGLCGDETEGPFMALLYAVAELKRIDDDAIELFAFEERLKFAEEEYNLSHKTREQRVALEHEQQLRGLHSHY